MSTLNHLIDSDPDLVLDLRDVSLRRDGTVLVGPLTWQVELDERWVVLGPNGAGKTSLLRIAAALDYPSTGTAVVLGEQLGRAGRRRVLENYTWRATAERTADWYAQTLERKGRPC